MARYSHRYASEFRQALIDCDVSLARSIWKTAFPSMPQPESDADVLVAIHMARTKAHSLPLKYRAYSHAWLKERGLPSCLPDYLKPKAERIYPRVVDAVGVAVSAPPCRKPLAKELERRLSDTVFEAYADGIRHPVQVKKRILAARDRFYRDCGLAVPELGRR